MIFKNDTESLEWKILQYQYPDAELSRPGDYSYDANWLMLQVCHEREGYGPAVFREPFLLTYELKELIDELQKLADGESFHYKGQYIEPVLEVEAERHRDDFLVSFDLYFDNYEMMVADTVSEEGLRSLIRQLSDLYNAYPER